MRRRLFTVLSLVLCLGVMLAWVRCYFSAGGGEWFRGRYSAGEYAVGCRSGELFAAIQPYPRAFPQALGGSPKPPGNSALAFTYREQRFAPGISITDDSMLVPLPTGAATRQFVSRTVAVRCWAAGLLLAVLPLIWIIRRLRQRPKVGCCTACGYNLTGNTSGVCPECGTPSTAGVKA
jgi:hypothetical protein